ncbi:MAG TPA: LPS assembly protein LptD [Tepidisphaeraceae bacterium]|nr:LPS assembly protein LptD [Tepidisphaeraceae bacterium]
MGWRGIFIVLAALVPLSAAPAFAQSQSPSEQLTLTGKVAATWIQDRDNVVLLRGPVKIAFDRATLTADNAVVWLAPASQDNLDIQNARVALLGHAKLERDGSTRTGDRLFVTALVRGQGIRIEADDRVARDDSKTELFRQARTLFDAEHAQASDLAVNAPATRATSQTKPATRPSKNVGGIPTSDLPLVFEAQNIESLNTDEGNVAIVLTGAVRLIERRPNNEYLELSADSAVLFTAVKSMKELSESGGKKHGKETINAAYLEGDVQIDFVPVRPGATEERLTANRCYYELATDRAVMTDAIIHTSLPIRGTPIIMRAKLVRQLAQGEFQAENTKLSTSSFAVPSYSLAAEKLYLKSEPSGDPRTGDNVFFDARNTSLEMFDIPFFFLPHTAGDMNRGFALRGVGGGNSHDFGPFFKTFWGLFETLGQAPPPGLDANYRLDYLGKRGPGAGVNAEYGGGFVTTTTRQPWDFEGELKSYFVYDHGEDDLGRKYERINDPATLRGQVLWEHEHYFPDGWQAQVRLGYVSDATFMEQWFRDEFQDGDPRNFVGYIKRQVDNEAFYFGATWQPNHLVTTSGQQQEQFEVDRLPQVGYYREGDSLLGDRLTFFSENDAEGLHFAKSRASLASQGFSQYVTPGQPALGTTGVPDQIIWRGDFRQEVDWPFTVGPLRVDPYVMGRFTEYSDSPQGQERARGMVGAGARVSTELWKVDPFAESDLLDIHQLRHVITPEINVFTSAMNLNRGQVFVFDESVDTINDISAAQFAINQRWETKRGGPGQWRNVDVFSLNVEVDVFENKPNSKLYNNPYDFRGLYFGSYPEESIPRDAVNADASWRLSDNTVVLGDTSFNLDRGRLATLAMGILVRRDTRFSYFVGNRYVADLNSNITSVHADYEITSKYTLDLDQQFDFIQSKNVISSVAILRKFDTFMMAFRYYVDETTHESGFGFNLFPIGLGQGFDTSSFDTFRK